MTSTMIEIAKEKDNGVFAKLGMQYALAKWFTVDINAPCVIEIIDTYLECIDNIDFKSWLYGLYHDGMPMILTRERLEKNYPDLMQVSEDLETISDLFMYLYDREFYVDNISDCIYSTNFKHFERFRLNYVGICMEYERLCTIYEFTELKWKDIDSIVAIMNEYGYDIEKDYDYRTDDIYETADNIIERLQQIFYL